MKKILLGSSALAVASLFAGAATAAEAPSLSVSGALEYHIVSLDSAEGPAIDINTQQYWSEIVFSGKGVTDGGLSYGAEVQWRPIGMSVDEAFLTFGSGFGTIVLGDEDGPFSGGEIYGFDYLPIGGQDAGPYGNGGGTGVNGETEDASKIMYKTPSMGGLQAALAYTPDSGGSFGNGNDVGTSRFHDVIELGVNFSGDFGGTSVDAHAAYGTGSASLDTEEDASFMQVGVKASMSGFTVALGHGIRGEGGCTVGVTGCDGGSFTDLGVTYSMDALTIGAGYFMGTSDASSTVSTDRTGMALEVGYGVAEGLYAFGGVHTDSQETTGAAAVDSTSVVVGTRISF